MIGQIYDEYFANSKFLDSFFDNFFATMMQIHDLIKQARIESGLTPEALATKIGVPRTTYLYWEENTPSIDKVKKVEVALGLPENFFLDALIKLTNSTDENLDTPKTVQISGTTSGKSTTKGTLRGVTSSGQDVFVNAKDLTASYERIIEEKERVIKIIQDQIDKAEKDKDRLFKALDEAQRTINEVLKPIKEKSEEILSNSKELVEDLSALTMEVQAEHKAIMDTVDKAAKQPIGTTAANADNVELASHQARGKKDKPVAGKLHKPQ